MGRFLDETELETLRAFAETLIPASREGPSAEEAEVSSKWVHVLLTERPDLVPKIRDLLKSYDGSSVRKYLERMENSQKEDFSVLTYVIAGAYFKSPLVKKWLGMDRILDEYECAEPELSARTIELLRPVSAMKPFYRPTSLERKSSDL